MHATLAQLLAAIPGATFVPGAGAQATNYATPDAVAISGVSTDSRTVAAGSLFVALRGETFDAHDFLEQVAGKGVAAVVAEGLPEGWNAAAPVPALLVPDTLHALGRIANHWRKQYTLPVIGVTGSNGKTTVKEMISAILAAAHTEDGRLATRGNLNNEIGVPLTLFRLDASHKSAVVELGMNHPGEIGRLAAIAEPTIAMVNNAQREHQEFMHTVEAVARENGAVLAALPADGVAVFPHGDEFTPIWRELSGERRTLTFGLTKEANVSCTYRAGDFGNQMFVTVREGGQDDGGAGPLQFFVALQAAGEHNVLNALAAVACTHAAGIGAGHIKLGLDTFAPVSGRLQKKSAANGAVIIDDSYNANPDSVRAAIDVLAKTAAPRVLVLGDMGEVGTQGREFHEEIAAYAASKNIEHVLVTGELAGHMAAIGATRHFKEFDALLSALDAAATPDATVLIKGSRFMKMERVVQHLIGSQQANKESH